MKTTRLVIPFRGPRTYIQGTDLYDTALGLLKEEGEATQIEFAAHKFIETNQVEALIYRDPRGSLPASPASLRCTIHGMPYCVLQHAVEHSGKELRVECKERLIMDRTAIEGNLAMLEGKSVLSMIETFVPMKKRLMQSLLPDAGVKWVFVRAEIEKDVAQIESAEVECLTLRESRIYQSVLRGNGKAVGKMYFIGVRQ